MPPTSFKKVVILLSQPLNDHVEKKLGIRRMLDENMTVEVLDLSSFMMPNYPAVDYTLEGERFCITRITNKKKLKIYLRELGGSVVAIDMSNPTPWIRLTLNRNNIKSIRLLTGGLPMSGPGSSENRVTASVAARKMFELLATTGFVRLLGRVGKELYNKLYIFFKKPYLDLIVLGGKQLLGNEFNYITEKTKIIESHVHDYEAYRDLPEALSRNEKKHVVFIDQNIPYHPDFALNGVRYSDADVYYARLRKLFDCLGQNGVEVIVALHPRDNNENTVDRFGHREARKDETVSLISKSDGIITHCSNAINFAVLWHKPIMFIADEELLEMSVHIKILSDWFGKRPVMLDREIDFDAIWVEMHDELENLKRYQDNFICCPGDSGRSISDVLINEIRAL